MRSIDEENEVTPTPRPEILLMREHGIGELSTFDGDFLTFPWVSMRPIEAAP